MKNWRSFSFTAGSRSLRQMIGSSGRVGEVQITFTLSASVRPDWRFSISEAELLVATSSVPLATASRLVL